MKKDVKDFWNESSCGESLYLKGFTKDDYRDHSLKRYELEPEILEFAEFHTFKGKKTLEIGVGLGADHQSLAEAGAELYGVDITPRAIGHTKRRFELFGLKSSIKEDDAENLSFDDNTFDAVYSWGVLHHSPNTAKAMQEVRRVLRPGGTAKIMIYHKYSFVGYMLWMRYGLLSLKPTRSLDFIYSNYLESPGTKAYSRSQLPDLMDGFNIVSVKTPLGHGDLLTSQAGQRHEGTMLSVARKIWPRKIIKTFFPSHGLEMMITCVKR